MARISFKEKKKKAQVKLKKNINRIVKRVKKNKTVKKALKKLNNVKNVIEKKTGAKKLKNKGKKVLSAATKKLKSSKTYNTMAKACKVTSSALKKNYKNFSNNIRTIVNKNNIRNNFKTAAKVVKKAFKKKNVVRNLKTAATVLTKNRKSLVVGTAKLVKNYKEAKNTQKKQAKQAITSLQNFISATNYYNQTLAGMAKYKKKYKEAVKNNDPNALFYKIAYEDHKMIIDDKKKNSLNLKKIMKDAKLDEARNAKKLRNAKEAIAEYERKLRAGETITNQDIEKYNAARKIIKINEIEKEGKKYYTPTSNYFDYLAAMSSDPHKLTNAEIKNISKNTSYLYNNYEMDFGTIYNKNNNYNDKYGGNQESFENNINKFLKDKTVDKIIKKYYPDKKFTNKDKKRLLTWLTITGCGYMDTSNMIYNDLESSKVDYKNYFSKNFGFNPYTVKTEDGEKIRNINYEYLALDYYLYKAKKQNKSFNEAVPKKMKYITDYRENKNTENIENVTRGSLMDDDSSIIQDYLNEKGLNTNRIHYANKKKVNTSLIMEIDEEKLLREFNKNKTLNKERVKKLLKEGKQISLSIGSYNDLNTNDKSLIMTNTKTNDPYYLNGHHAVSLTGVDNDGNYIISSWGKEFKFNDEKGISTVRVSSIT